MHQGYRYLTSFFLAAALASPVAIAQQDDQRRGDDQRQQQDQNHQKFGQPARPCPSYHSETTSLLVYTR